MNQNNLLKYLLPVVAIIVVAESLMLMAKVKSPKSVPQNSTPTTVAVGEQNGTPASVPEVYNISLAADKTNLKKGEVATVSVKMVGSENKSLDSVNVYVKYDPNLLDVQGLQFDKKLPVPAFSKASTLRGLLVANFLVSDVKGLSVKAGESINLMTFKAKALKAGSQTFEISTGKEMKESATMIVETATSKQLGFSSNKLTINVTE